MESAPSFSLSSGPRIKEILAPPFYLDMLPGAQSNGLPDHSLTAPQLSHSDLFFLLYWLIAEICHRNRTLANKGSSDTWENSRAHTEGRSCEQVTRGHLSASQGEEASHKPNSSTPRSQVSSFQTCKKVNFSYLNCSICGILLCEL